MTLKERAIIGKEMLAKQKGVTYEKALESIKMRKTKSNTIIKKKVLVMIRSFFVNYISFR